MPKFMSALEIALTAWFAFHQRALPWRTAPRDPYRTWLSEIMLQQTQVATVLAYFARFTARFPRVDDLAAAELDEVLALWSGLGYYARGRNLHKAAREVSARGGFPTTVDGLRALPGVGPYTAAAIANLCFGSRAPAVDGNVLRVISRVFNSDLVVDHPSGRAFVQEKVAALLEVTGDPAAITEGLMELGALVCTPRAPRCYLCPWGDVCAGRARASELPARAKKRARKVVHLDALVIVDDDRVLLAKNPTRGLFGGLLSPPLGDRALLEDELGLEAPIAKTHVRRTLTHRELLISVFSYRARLSAHRYVARDALDDVEVSAAARAILRAGFLETD